MIQAIRILSLHLPTSLDKKVLQESPIARGGGNRTLAHNHLIARHTAQAHEGELEDEKGEPDPPPAPVALILVHIPKRVNDSTHTPRRAEASTRDRIYQHIHTLN